jgi:hypothetical protein
MPDPPVLYRIGGKDVDVTGGGWGFLLSRLTRHGAKLLSGLADARRDEGLPDGQLSTADWISKFTQNKAVHGIFRSMCGSVFAVGADELPARVFLTYATVRLVGDRNLPVGYTEAVKRADRPCAMISVNFASREPLMTAPGLLSFASTRRLCYAANFTATCPEMAPGGWHLYVGTAVPQPAIGNFDEAAETGLLLADLREQIPGFDRARILSTVVTRDDWPPQRAVAGFDLPHDTPIANLWNVGDGVKEYANGGTTACAETAQLVAQQVAERYPAGSAA